MIRVGVDVIIIETGCIINVMYLNHPETMPHLVCGKNVFHEAGPRCQKFWGPLTWEEPDKFPCLLKTAAYQAKASWLFNWYLRSLQSTPSPFYTPLNNRAGFWLHWGSSKEVAKQEVKVMQWARHEKAKHWWQTKVTLCLKNNNVPFEYLYQYSSLAQKHVSSLSLFYQNYFSRNHN